MKVMIVMRTDLNMRKGKMIAQGGHAIHLLVSYIIQLPCRVGGEGGSLRERYQKWMDGPFTKICVGIDSEQALIELMRECDEAHVASFPIFDSGKTEFGGKETLTCCAIGPATDEELKPLTGHLKLL